MQKFNINKLYPKIFTRFTLIVSLVALVKIILTFTIQPQLYIKWFIPFVKNFCMSDFSNPWNSFLAIGGHIKAFPYGTGMLFILAVPFGIQSFFSELLPAVGMMDVFLLRIPVLLADIAIFYLLIRSFKLDKTKVLYFYWCSPVVLYGAYIHGQLDIIPMLFMLLAILLCINKRIFISACVLGVGLAIKENMLFALPLLLIYLLKETKSWKKTAGYGAVVSVVYVVMLAPVFLSQGYQTMVLNASERSWIYLSSISFGHSTIFLIPLAIALLYFKFSLYRKVNKDILIMYIGMAFAILVLFMPSSAPGWYIWIIPFLCYYAISSQKFHASTLALFSALFIMLFLTQVPYPVNIIDPQSKSTLVSLFPGISQVQVERVRDLTFTFLQGILVFITVSMYLYGIRSNRIYKERKMPILIGVGGNSGSGKDTLCHSLKTILGGDDIIQADGDDLHKWERGHDMWRVYSHLHPKANDLFLQFKHTRLLKSGNKIMRSSYDHKTGKFLAPKVVESNKYIFVSGLHPFYLKSMRELIDIKIYLDTDDELRKSWKVKRDVQERNHAKDNVVATMENRKTDSLKFIEPQKKYADVIIRYEPANEFPLEDMSLTPALKVNFTFDNSIHVEDMLAELNSIRTLAVTHFYEDIDKQYLGVEGRIHKEDLAEIAARTLPNIDEIVEGDIQFEDNLKGVVQLLMLSVISYTKLYKDQF